jgi:hypothetical protein
VPVGADPASLASSGIVLSVPLNLNPPINYQGALNVMSTCDPWAYQHLASAGLTHVQMLYFNNGPTGANYSADVWAFATFPGTSWGSTPGGTQWQLWFIDAGSGSCFGADYGVAPAVSAGTNGVNPNVKPAPGQFEPY